MTFTDDDLKRLKDYIGARQFLSHDVPVHPDIAGFFSEVEALLARLEAVELRKEHLEIRGGYCPCGCDGKWRKAMGK